MKAKKIQTLIMILILHLTLNKSIEIKNFVKYAFLDKTTFIYNLKPNIKYEDDAYFFFSFSNSHTDLYIQEQYKETILRLRLIRKMNFSPI